MHHYHHHNQRHSNRDERFHHEKLATINNIDTIYIYILYYINIWKNLCVCMQAHIYFTSSVDHTFDFVNCIVWMCAVHPQLMILWSTPIDCWKCLSTEIKCDAIKIHTVYYWISFNCCSTIITNKFVCMTLILFVNDSINLDRNHFSLQYRNDDDSTSMILPSPHNLHLFLDIFVDFGTRSYVSYRSRGEYY